MMNTLLALSTILIYGLSTAWQGLYITRNSMVPLPSQGVFYLGIVAVILHSILLHHWIDTGVGQNLTFFNLFSLVAWLVALLIVLAMIRKPVANLTLFIFPIAAISIILVGLFPAFEIVNTAAKPKELIHILLSTITFSVLCITALQAVLLAVQQRLLRRKKAVTIIQILPPLEVMESLLFQMMVLGFVLLSFVLLSSVWCFYPFTNVYVWQKLIVSLFVWLVFATLLAGRRFFGWRGVQVICWTLGGVFLVMLAYFGKEILSV